MLAVVKGAFLEGVEARCLEIEVDFLPRGRAKYHVVGLPDAAIRESGKRVRAALENSGFDYPRSGEVTVNLSPAGVKKVGSGYELPIALALLAVLGRIGPELLSGWLIMGELALNGRVQPIRGALPVAHCAESLGTSRLLLPPTSAEQAALVPELSVFRAASLREALSILKEPRAFECARPVEALQTSCGDLDLDQIRGQRIAKRALEVACAGGHNLLLIGSPGSGKTMLARRTPGILPPLTSREALETMAILSVASDSSSTGLCVARPFRDPHHSVSRAGLLGGGSLPRPGEISLAHKGVLFLDELPEFPRSVLESLRQPMESGTITLSRAAGTVSFPAHFMLVAAMNPCPCGYLGNCLKPCVCTPNQIRRYRHRISGPLLDRFDLQVVVPHQDVSEFTKPKSGDPSSEVRKRVIQARALQRERFKDVGLTVNSQMGANEIEQFCVLPGGCQSLLQNAMRRFALSGRAYHRILKVARTVADLEGAAEIQEVHISEAIHYRTLGGGASEVPP